MKKSTVKAFTLVEMLIVIVIIGILIAALMPRMQAAQGRARDISRKTALSQIQSAIVVWQGDNGKWPGGTGAEEGITLDVIDAELRQAGLNGVPKDPLGDTSFFGLNMQQATGSQYQYMVTTRNGTKKGGFILMAKTEVAGSSNWVICNETATEIGQGKIGKEVDLKSIVPCETITKTGATNGCAVVPGGDCTYTDDGQLRYIVSY